MIHCYEFYTSPVISKPRYFELFFHFPWDFEIAGFDCSVVHSFKNMSKEELIRECKGRHLPVNGLLQPVLESNLKEALRDIQRVAALCFPQQECALQEFNLGNYEVLPVEPLHDLKEHIKNTFKELPKHLNDEGKVLFDEYFQQK